MAIIVHSLIGGTRVESQTLVPEFARFAIGNLGIGNMGSSPRSMVKTWGKYSAAFVGSHMTEWAAPPLVQRSRCAHPPRHGGASSPKSRSRHQWQSEGDKWIGDGEASAPLSRRGSSIFTADNLSDFRIWYSTCSRFVH
jgi:hypothetical protein